MRSKTQCHKEMKRIGHVKEADQALTFKSKVGKLSNRIWFDYIFSEKGGQILENKAVIWLAANDRKPILICQWGYKDYFILFSCNTLNKTLLCNELSVTFLNGLN